MQCTTPLVAKPVCKTPSASISPSFQRSVVRGQVLHDILLTMPSLKELDLQGVVGSELAVIRPLLKAVMDASAGSRRMDCAESVRRRS